MSQAHVHYHRHQHQHHHEEVDDPYYVDQMCLVALSAAFGVICLSLYFWQVKIMELIVATYFFPYVLISGVCLVMLAVLRGAVLWVQVGKQPVDTHHHGHDQEPAAALAAPAAAAPAGAGAGADQGDAPCGHDHHHEKHNHANGETQYVYRQASGHSHSHGHDGHDHGWAPWRYILLMVPIILIVCSVPRQPPLKAVTTVVDNTKEAMFTARWIALEGMPFSQAGMLMANAVKRRVGEVKPLDFVTLEGSASRPEDRKYWENLMAEGAAISIKGQFNKNPNNNRVFALSRQKINCCVNDLVQLNVPIICREGIDNIENGKWVEVTGEIQYRKDAAGVFHTLVMVQDKTDVKETEPDANPYISAK